MIIYTMKATFLKCQILMFFLFWNVKNVKVDLMVNVKMATLSAKFVLKKRLNTSLKDLSLALTNHGRHGLFSFLSSLPISVLRNLELETNKLYDRANKLYKAALLTGVMFNISLVLISILRSTINDILSKFHSFTKVLNLLIYIVSSRIIQ